MLNEKYCQIILAYPYKNTKNNKNVKFQVMPKYAPECIYYNSKLLTEQIDQYL